jgi:hypothetical protein
MIINIEIGIKYQQKSYSLMAIKDQNTNAKYRVDDDEIVDNVDFL